MTTKAVTKKQASEVATFNYGDDAGVGLDLKPEEMLLPWLNVLQGQSPQVQKPMGEGGVDGARAGMLMNSVTEQLFQGKEGVLFVPAARQHEVIEWKPREKGGGLVAKHSPASDVVQRAKDGAEKFGKLNTDYTKNSDGKYQGNDLVQTFIIFGVLVNEEGLTEPIAMAFTSTKITPYKKWIQKLYTYGRGKVPLFAHLTRMTTVSESRAAGDSFNVVLAPANGDLAASLLAPDDERFLAAKSVAVAFQQGLLRTPDPEQGGGVHSDAMDGPVADGDAPF